MRIERGIALAPFVLALVVGCGSVRAPEIAHYLLRSEEDARGVEDLTARPAIGLGAVRVADYLATDGIVVAVAPDQLRTARLARWSEPLEASLRVLLAGRASRSLDHPVLSHAGRADLDLIVDLFVEAFHADEAGEVRLVARWSIEATAPGVEARRFRFSDRAQMRATGYPELVRAHVALAERLADAIAGSLEGAAEGAAVASVR